MFTKRNTLVILGVTAGVLIIAGGSFALVRHRQNREASADSNINYGPVTEEEKKETEAHKQQLDQDTKNASEPSPPPTEDGKRTVYPMIVTAEQYDNTVEVTSYISGIIEDGGTCTITLTKGTDKITKTVTGVRDAKVTRCPIVTVPLAEFPSKGNWTAVVTYSSTAATGASQPSGSFEVK